MTDDKITDKLGMRSKKVKQIVLEGSDSFV